MKKTPGSRREGRTLAVQLIFMLDHNRMPFDEALPGFVAFKKDDDEPLVPVEKSREFCEKLARGVSEHWDELDGLIKDTTANFSLHRIGGIERAILRLAIYEMLYCLETPPVVSINEGVEIAKRLSGDEAGRFVNGVLDKVRATLSRPSRTAAAPPTQVQLMEQRMEEVARQLGEAPQEFSPGRDASPEGN